MFEMVDAGLYLVVQEDNHMFLSIPYLSPHFTVVWGMVQILLQPLVSLFFHDCWSLFAFLKILSVGPLGSGCVLSACADWLIASVTQSLATG